jgi:Fe-S-cluster containining protein
MCGKCCRELSGFSTYNEKQKEIKTAQYENLIKNTPIYPFNKLEDESMMLFEWEVEKLNKIAASKKINLRIKPGHGILSSMGTVIVMNWMFDYETCPFLENNKCSIYDERPLVCQAFPFYTTVYSILRGNKNIEIGPLDCPELKIENIFENKINNHKEWGRNMFETYGEPFIGSVKADGFN